MIDNELVTRDDGKVALKQIGKTNISVPVQVGGVVYSAELQHNVWLAWVAPEHVEELLTKKIKSCSCNDAAVRPLFKIASVLDVSLFDTGDRPH